MEGKNYQEKIISMEAAVSMVQSHHTIGMGIAGSEPVGLLQTLASRKNDLEDVTLWTCLPMRSYEIFSEPEMHICLHRSPFSITIPERLIHYLIFHKANIVHAKMKPGLMCCIPKM